MTKATSVGIDFQRTFGAPAAQPAREKAVLWLNLGYSSGVIDDDGKEKFVSLPLGIPLDTQEHLPTSSKNADFAKFQAARNNLLDQLMEAAKSLAPGESRVVKLEVQLRRVSAEAGEIPVEGNQFARKIDL